jgi:pimeloyl-ACP methyl ester carboxylesterase
VSKGNYLDSDAETLTERVVRGLAGLFAAHPWFDRGGLHALERWYFPLSRLWAAACEAGGDAARYYDGVPMVGRFEDRARLTHALARYEQARAAATAIETQWRATLFGDARQPAASLKGVEDARLSLRHSFNATRRHFHPLLKRKPPRARVEIATPGEVESAYGDALLELGPFISAPDPMPEVAVSHAVPSALGWDRWLTFQSPARRVGGLVTARVHEPEGVANPPTVIFGHGICVEFDHWRGLIDEVHALVREGFRVIRPEAAWHGRRTPQGYYGGERIIATFPAGVLDALLGAVREWAVVADWARRTSSGALGFGGSSLGALTAQLAASLAREWPEPLRPDGLFLVTHAGDLAHCLASGVLSRVFAGLEEALRVGWREDELRRYLSLLNPEPAPVVPASRIVSILGRRDVVLPFDSGRRLVEDWCLPEANLFLLDRGHFSVPATLLSDKRPARRFREVMR